jgi:hypothetical protein
MMKQQMTDIHREFLEDCMSEQVYLKFIRVKLKYVHSFNEQELQKYHKAYVKLVTSHGDYSGCQLRTTMKTLMDSVKNPDEKLIEYKRVVEQETELFNTANAVNPRKQIKL